MEQQSISPIRVEIWNDDTDFYLTDQGFHMQQWAKENCPSFKEYEYIDMSDIDSWTGACDNGYFYYFNDEQDALLFSLKFQGVK